MKTVVARRISPKSTERVRKLDTPTLESYLPVILMQLSAEVDAFLYHSAEPNIVQYGIDALNAVWTELERRKMIPPPLVLVEPSV